MSRRYLIAGALLLAACAKPETAEQTATRMQAESDSARVLITAQGEATVRHMNANHPDSMAATFTENGIMMPPAMPAITGRAAIQAHQTANPLPPGARLAVTPVDVVANGPIAIERGTYVFSMPAMGRTPAMNVNGKYLAHWHKVNGTWLQAALMWSDDVYVPPMAPPRS